VELLLLLSSSWSWSLLLLLLVLFMGKSVVLNILLDINIFTV